MPSDALLSLHGLSSREKGLNDVAGLPAAPGPCPFLDLAPERNGTVVEALQKNGAMRFGTNSLTSVPPRQVGHS